MIIVADGGSTKIKWAIQEGPEEWNVVTTSGINPLMLSAEEIEQRLRDELTPRLRQASVRKIIYYGAGCIPSACRTMKQAIANATGIKEVTVGSDMLGAARALCGHNEGIACILGTGSNSCRFDGKEIVDSIPPLGYILGDEGSGASIGRRFISAIFKRRLPESVRKDFVESTGLDLPEIIDQVYRQKEANRFLASLVPFVKANVDDPAIELMVTDEFCRFLTINVAPYGAGAQIPVNFTGSIAEVFKPQLVSALRRCGMTAGTITADPIIGLINYHSV